MAVKSIKQEQNSNMDIVLVAKVVAAHGIKGLVKVQSLTHYPEDFMEYTPLQDKSGNVLSFSVTGETKGMFMAQFEGVDTRDDAEKLKGLDIYALRTNMGELAEDEIFANDLIGMDIVDADGKAQGQVVNIVNYGSCDLLDVRFGDKSYFIPYLEEHITLVDTDNNKIEARDIEGFLELGGVK